MEYDKSDAERPIGIQGMHWSAFGEYFWNREGSFKQTKIYLMLL